MKDVKLPEFSEVWKRNCGNISKT